MRPLFHTLKHHPFQPLPAEGGDSRSGKWGLWLAASCLLLAIGSASAAPVEALKTFLANLQTLEATFTQMSIDENGNPGERSHGELTLAKPGRFRWDYQMPYHQEIVSDGNKVWFYDADLEQVTVKSLNQALGTSPALLLSGEVALEENYSLTAQGEVEGLQWVRLQPKSEDSGFTRILIGMDGGRLGGMELSDNFGQQTRIYFSAVKTNQPVDPARFLFQPPSGVDIFEE